MFFGSIFPVSAVSQDLEPVTMSDRIGEYLNRSFGELGNDASCSLKKTGWRYGIWSRMLMSGVSPVNFSSGVIHARDLTAVPFHMHIIYSRTKNHSLDFAPDQLKIVIYKRLMTCHHLSKKFWLVCWWEKWFYFTQLFGLWAEANQENEMLAFGFLRKLWLLGFCWDYA